MVRDAGRDRGHARAPGAPASGLRLPGTRRRRGLFVSLPFLGRSGSPGGSIPPSWVRSACSPVLIDTWDARGARAFRRGSPGRFPGSGRPAYQIEESMPDPLVLAYKLMELYSTSHPAAESASRDEPVPECAGESRHSRRAGLALPRGGSSARRARPVAKKFSRPDRWSQVPPRGANR